MHWLAHVLGVDTQRSYWYDFWSGIATQAGLVTLAVGAWWRHTCHVHGCWRLGRHPVAGTTWVVCRRHHPDGAPAAGDVIAGSRGLA